MGTASLVLPLPFPGMAVFCSYQGMVNTVRSLSDKSTPYPLSIQFVK